MTAKLANGRRDNGVEGGGSGEAERQAADFAAIGALGGELCLFRGIDGGSCLGEEGLAGRRQLRPVRYAVEQLRSHLVFQIPDLLAERRLADTEIGGGTGEISFFRKRQKIADMTQLHRYLQKLLRSPVPYIGLMRLT